MFSGVSLKAKLTGAFALVALITFIVGLVGYKGMNFAKKAHDRTANVLLPATNALWMIKDGQDVARRVELVIFQAQLSEAERKGMRKNLKIAKDQAEQGIKIFESLPANPETAELWKDFQAAWHYWEKVNEEIIGAMEKEGGDREAAYATATGESRVAFHNARVVLDKLIKQEMTHAEQTGVAFNREYDRTRYVTLASVMLGAALAFGFGTLLSSSISGMLTRLVEKAREISGGELRSRMPEEGYVELRELAGAFNAMADNLATVIRQIQEASGSVDAFSSDFTMVIQEQATAASQQAASLAEVTATMEELSRTSHQIAGNANSVKESAERTVEMAQQGTFLVREGVEGMSRIKDRVTEIAQKTRSLGEKSQEIGKVMDLIKEIAGEIHLLALNAAIESAAAGEHGRRFAVVASEVRRLAEKTRESTESIRAIVGEIQSATQSSILATEQGNQEVDMNRETVRRSSDAFEEIIGMIEKTSEASMMISLATHQQTSANDQVAAGMRQVAETVHMTAAQIRQSSVSAAELKRMSALLTEKTAVFRV